MHVEWSIVYAFPVICELVNTMFSHLLVKLNTTPRDLFPFIDTFTWIFCLSIAQHKLLQVQQNCDINTGKLPLPGLQTVIKQKLVKILYEDCQRLTG